MNKKEVVWGARMVISHDLVEKYLAFYKADTYAKQLIFPSKSTENQLKKLGPELEKGTEVNKEYEHIGVLFIHALQEMLREGKFSTAVQVDIKVSADKESKK